MEDLLADQQRTLLSDFAEARVLVAFDFDGTLAPIVDAPDAARLPERTRERLHSVAERYPCAVISGRSLADMHGRLAGLPLFALVGNHGIEPSFAMQDYERAVREHLAELSQRVTQLQGVLVEDKRYSLAVHYRGAHDKSTALRAIRAAAADLSKVFRAIGGKQVLNLVPLGAPHKGTALERLRQESQTDKMLYVGDDMTDEDVFALDQPDRLISVRVGLSKTTRARYYIRSQREIDSLLERLIELRRA